MSLYEEAVLDAKKLLSVAEEEARKAIVEQLTPSIRGMLTQELNRNSTLFFEEEDPTAMASGPEVAAPMDDPTGQVTPSPTPTPTPAVTGGATDVPIKVAGADALNMPMPGADGKLVVDFDDMFVPVEPGEEDQGDADQSQASANVPAEVPGGLPSPTPVDALPAPTDANTASPGTGELTPVGGEPETTMETYELFSEALENTSKSIARLRENKKHSGSIVTDYLQEKLFSLLESLEKLAENKKITPKLASILESRLEILHYKLKEAVVGNTYSRIEEGTEMASKGLKDIAAQLIAESDSLEGGPVTSPADSHKTEKSMTVNNAEEKGADKAGTHAMKASEPTVTLKTEAAELAKLEEELRALQESEGDSLAAEPGKQDLAGAASTIPDKKVGQVDTTKSTSADGTNPASHVQGVAENIEHSKDTGSEEEVEKTSTGHPVKKESVAVTKKAIAEQTKKLKAENLKKQIAALQEQLKECGMPMEGDALPAPGGKGQQSVMGEDDVTVNFNFDLADLIPGLDGLSDDDSIEITDGDEDDDLASVIGGSEDGEEPSMPGSEEEPESELPLQERVRAGKGPAAKKLLSENKSLTTKLEEQVLLNAQIVHFQPFVNNRNLTKEQKQKIAEYLAKGKTVEEVKSLYESAKATVTKIQKAKAKAGSSSRAGGSGGINLSEGNHFEGSELEAPAKTRLMELAGIKRK